MARLATLFSRAVLALLPLWVAAQQSPPSSHNDILIKNAVVMTVTHGNVQNGSVYIKDGKIAAVGKDVNAPSTATVIDAGGNDFGHRHVIDRMHGGANLVRRQVRH